MTKKQQLEARFARHIQRIDFNIAKLEKKSGNFSKLRTFTFIGGFAIMYLLSRQDSDFLFFGILIALIATFLVMVTLHERVNKTIKAFEILKTLKKEHISRMNLKWNEIDFPLFKESKVDRNHPFADDLNILGEKSLQHLVDTCIYEGSSKRLTSWLLEENPSKEKIIARQKMVQDLSPLSIFRDKLRVQAAVSKSKFNDKEWSFEKMITWLGLPKKGNFVLPIILLSLLSIGNIVLGIYAFLGVIPPYVIITFVSYLVLYKLNSHKIAGLFDAAYQMEGLLSKFSSILLHVEKFNFKKESELESLCEPFQKGDSKPSTFLKKISKLAGAASLQTNQVLWPLVNLLMPWDLYYARKMEFVKSDLEENLSTWLDRFYELEALSSLANFSALNPTYTFPILISSDSENLFSANDMGHPLLEEKSKVTNNYSIQKGKDLFLITGSNMAGKSTFLRTVGINLILTFSGAPVNASTFESKIFRIFSSINVKDSLDDGLSHFYSEVKRLKLLLDKLEENTKPPLFFFVDEIFKGTNNRERFAGSTAFLKEVAGKNGVGLVSTHDLDLADLEKEIPQLTNLHFEETIKEQKMKFDYKLKYGPCTSTNALKIMEIEGLPT